MSLRFRRILYLIFILLFIIIAPLVCLYAAGFTLTSGFKIEKTGILILDSEPRGAKIYLNDKLQQKLIDKVFSPNKNFLTTPVKIKNLKPSEYDVRVESENYWPWMKKLKVSSGESTFAEDIILFKKDIPVLMQPGKYNNISFSPDKTFVILEDDTSITIFDLKNEHLDQYFYSTSTKKTIQSTEMEWSPDKNQIIYNNMLLNKNQWQKPFEIVSHEDKDYSLLKWGKDNEKIYYINTSGLFSLSLSNKKVSHLYANANISDFLIKNSFTYLIENNHTHSTLLVLDGNLELIRRINLPLSVYEFQHTDSKLINIYDKKYRLLYLINPLSTLKPLNDTIANVAYSHWVNDSLLIYSDGFEIYMFNLETNKKILLTRISNEIKGLFWHPSDNYVIYSTQNSINIIELDDREKRNITELINLGEIKSVELDTTGNIIYFFAQIGNQSGLYKLAI